MVIRPHEEVILYRDTRVELKAFEIDNKLTSRRSIEHLLQAFGAHNKKGWKNLFAYMGPGFLVSIAYIDPGNFETDLQSGAQYKYELHVLLLSFSHLQPGWGVMTGKHLAEHCRAEYPRVPNFILWILAEIAVVACDIPEGLEYSDASTIATIWVAFLINVSVISVSGAVCSAANLDQKIS
ncbi:hypothetical protein J5N97_017730 [Dioscorea zingiberensis]|uniref:Uncharacterized protein n=1 Tax=Dioscorea zingiberensis TaxID=325984 RepID=A0A9D5HGN0_9LILI|nr:hypothetical protein J5N97_017730 [Dioscorea zingiberensis]